MYRKKYHNKGIIRGHKDLNPGPLMLIIFYYFADTGLIFKQIFTRLSHFGENGCAWFLCQCFILQTYLFSEYFMLIME